MAISYPPIFINDYLQEKLQGLINLNVPFFPTMPSTIDQLTQNFANLNNQAGLFAVYDRMFKMRRKAFPHIKDEQLLYYFYGTATDAVASLTETTQIVSDLLDRGDESAQDLNAWIESKLAGGIYAKPDGQAQTKEFLPVYFHDIKIYQLEETRDIIDFGTARTYAGNKIIIDYCYHSTGYNVGINPSDPVTYNGTAL